MTRIFFPLQLKLLEGAIIQTWCDHYEFQMVLLFEIGMILPVRALLTLTIFALFLSVEP